MLEICALGVLICRVVDHSLLPYGQSHFAQNLKSELNPNFVHHEPNLVQNLYTLHLTLWPQERNGVEIVSTLAERPGPEFD